MASRHTAVALDERDHAHGHAVVPHINFGLLLVDAWQLADRLHEPGACRGRPGRKIRGPTVAQHAPLRGALGLEELLRADLVVHHGPPCRRTLLRSVSRPSGRPPALGHPVAAETPPPPRPRRAPRE